MAAGLNVPASAWTHDVAAKESRDIDGPASIDDITPAASEPTLQTPEACPMSYDPIMILLASMLFR